MNTPAPRFCSACGTALPDGSRFCPGCGAAVAPATPARAAGERRRATILFIDLSGFTALSASLDPEETHALLQDYFAAVDGAVAAHGGRVDKHIGDATMAVFGAPIALGGEPRRAVAAALEARQAIQALGARLGRSLSMHGGIASGEVVAAEIASGAHVEYAVTGEAVNLAARLLDQARNDEIMVSASVMEALAGSLDAEDAGEITVKGFAAPVRGWRVRGLVESASEAPLVGREREVAQFEGVLDHAAAAKGAVVVVRGEAGLGKTRLVEACTVRATARGFHCQRALVLDFGGGRAEDPLRALARGLLGLARDADEPTIVAAIDQAIGAGWIDAGERVFAHELVDASLPAALRGLYDALDVASRRDGRHRCLADLAAGAGRAAPRLIVVEDIHWADKAVLSALASLAARIRDCAVVLVMTARPEGDPLDRAWRGAARGPVFLTLDLAPLDERESLALALATIERDPLLVRECVRRAEGNPLFLVQLLRGAAESAAALPDSIASVVQARADRLPVADKRAIQAASIIGQRFSLALVRALIDDPAYEADALVRDFLIRPEGDGFLFAHALIREGIQSTLLRNQKRALHARAAAWYAERDRALAADHLAAAGAPEAPSAYRLAAEAAIARLQFDEALGLAERGLALASQPGDRCALAIVIGECRREVGQAEASLSAFTQAREDAQDGPQRARAEIGVASACRVLSRLDQAGEALDRAVVALGDAPAESARGWIAYLRGSLHFTRGESVACDREHRAALHLARTIGDHELEARALSGVADAAYAMGRMNTALAAFQECRDLCRARGLGRIEVTTRFMIGHCLIYASRLDEGLAEFVDARSQAVQVGSRMTEMFTFESTGMALVAMGRPDEALADLDVALTMSRSLGTRRFDSFIELLRAMALRGLDRRDEASQAIDAAIAIVRETGPGFVGALALGVRAELAASWDDAARDLAEGEAFLAKGAVAHNHLWFHASAIDAALRWGQPEVAERHAEALRAFTRHESLARADFIIARGLALAACARGRRSPEIRADLVRLAEQARREKLLPMVPALDAAIAAS